MLCRVLAVEGGLAQAGQLLDEKSMLQCLTEYTLVLMEVFRAIVARSKWRLNGPVPPRYGLDDSPYAREIAANTTVPRLGVLVTVHDKGLSSTCGQG